MIQLGEPSPVRVVGRAAGQGFVDKVGKGAMKVRGSRIKRIAVEVVVNERQHLREKFAKVGIIGGGDDAVDDGAALVRLQVMTAEICKRVEWSSAQLLCFVARVRDAHRIERTAKVNSINDGVCLRGCPVIKNGLEGLVFAGNGLEHHLIVGRRQCGGLIEEAKNKGTLNMGRWVDIRRCVRWLQRATDR